MHIPSQPVTYTGTPQTLLQDIDSHTTSDDDYELVPNWHVKTVLVDPSKAPTVRVKKVRRLQPARSAEQDY